MIDNLPAAEKLKALNRLSFDKGLAQAGYQLRKLESGEWEVTGPDGSQGTVEPRGVFVSGLDALIPLEIHYRNPADQEDFLVSMRFEDGDWRIKEVAPLGPWNGKDLESALAQKFDPARANEAAAVRSVLVIAGAVARYAMTFPDRGYPANLHVLCSSGNPEQKQPGDQQSDDEVAPEPPQYSPEHAGGILEGPYCEEPLVLNGYRFNYTLLNSGAGLEHPWETGAFQLSASPLEFGRTGSRSFFLDRNGLHVTDDNRPANENDPGSR